LAILLLNQLKRFSKIQNQRKKIVNFYLKNLNYVSPSTLYVSQQLIRFPLLIENRDKILQNLAKKGIFLGRWYDSPVAPKGFPLDKVGYRWGSCSQAEEVCQKIINLPTNNIKLNEAKKINQNIKRRYI
jgi:dTDP-4-amino-4,6-dideoxygalactose transaminase